MDQLENVGTIIPGENVPQDTPNTEPNTETQSPDIEARARAMGWRPQDEFRGDPGNWRSAEEFVSRGENEMPILRENLRRTTDQVTELQSRLARQEQEFNTRVERLDRMGTAALDRQRADLERQWGNSMYNAAANGDMDAYRQLEQNRAASMAEFDRQAAEIKQPAKPEQTQPQGQPQMSTEDSTRIEGWIGRNPWFKSDGELNAVAVAYSGNLTRQNPALSLDDNLKQTEAYVRKRYADKFGMSSGGSAPVEGGAGAMPNSMGRGKGWNELPADARAQGAKFIKDGLFKDQNDYAKEYWSQ